jgi:tetratricopeptide (TPR) repeat protein
LLIAFLVLLVVALIGLAIWWRAQPDMIAVLQANNIGVGHMERFEKQQAVEAFEKVGKLAPRWVPGQVNLGIALLVRNDKDGNRHVDLERAVSIFNNVLRQEPDNPYAHYCLGFIFAFVGKQPEAATQFEAVTRIDPNDAQSWYRLGANCEDDPKKKKECFERALKLDPYLNAAVYALGMVLIHEGRTEEGKRLLDEHQALAKAMWYTGPQKEVRYTEMGRYASVIDPIVRLKSAPRTGPMPFLVANEKFRVNLRRGSRWAAGADFGKGAVADLRRAVRERFGATLVVLDYNHDGRPDLFLLGAVLVDGKVEDLLLRNDGGGEFTDVTVEAGLAGPRPSLGCCIGDFDNDGYADIFITGVGEQRLFRNTGLGRFEDVTAVTTLDKLKTVCLGACFIDIDQDGDLDLVIAQYARTAEEALAALRNTRKVHGPGLAVYLNIGEAQPAQPSEDPPPLPPRFMRLEKPEALLAAGLSATGIVMSDFDTDGDMDLLVLADLAPLDLIFNDRLLRFHHAALPTDLAPAGRWNGGLTLDANHDDRFDLFLLGPGQPPVLLLNEPMPRPKEPKQPMPNAPPPGPPPVDNGQQAGVSNNGGADSSSLFLFGPGQPPIPPPNKPKSRFEPPPPGAPPPEDSKEPATFSKASVESPPLLQAHAVDIDLDGWMDVVGLSEKRLPVLLHNNGQRLVHAAEQLGSDAAWPGDLVAVATASLNGSSFPDLLVWSETQGLRLYENKGNGNSALHLELTGHRKVHSKTGGEPSRTNADGIGTMVTAEAKDHRTSILKATLSAGLGQSNQPLVLGLGKHTQPDVVRLLWPDNVPQAEFNVPVGQVFRLDQVNRKTTSCPLLFAWNGERFGFITDFLGASSMGEQQPEGGCRPPRPEESVKIEVAQMVPRDGYYVLKVAEAMNEVVYLDRLQLIVLDHPEGVRVYPDERFASTAPPVTQDLFGFRQEIFPVRARDHGGRDVTDKLKAWDRNTVDGFRRRSWLGYAEEHWVELDFGDRLARFGAKDPLILCLAGWTDYPYPESIWAATQAGVELQPPVLEKRDANGQWQAIVADAGFPAGLPRMMTLDVTGKLGGPSCVVRLRTNMQVFWDQIFVAPVLARQSAAALNASAIKNEAFHARALEVADATLQFRGCLQELSPDGRKPTIYDYDRLDSVPVSRFAGKFTRTGDVTDLLRARDDRFVIFGPGDEVTVRFDARKLPALPKGWQRSFVLRSWGYSKDSGPFTATGDTIEPLPFHGMTTYPYGPGEHYPQDAAHDEYRRAYNTRQVGPETRRIRSKK